VALDRLPPWAARAALAATAALALVTIADMVRLHPYEYLYFNRAVAGGLAGASRDFELDYWGATGREAMAWVERNVETAGDVPLSVATTLHQSVAAHWLAPQDRARFRFTSDPLDVPDLRLVTTRWFEHRATGKVLHVIERMGVPLLYVIQTFPENEPLVLEGGDAAVALAPADGWAALPKFRFGDDRDAFLLVRSRGQRAEGEVRVLTPSSGGIPDAAALRAEVTALADEASRGPTRSAPRAIEGPGSRGWLRVGARTAAFAVQVGPAGGPAAALVGSIHFEVAPDRLEAELEDWIRSARLADGRERRPP
jgi:hypothetical protein